MSSFDLSTIKLVEPNPKSGKSLTTSSHLNVFSVDVEEWFQVGAFENTISRADWPRLESRVEQQTDAILNLLSLSGISATFFCLGWVGQRAPSLIKRIVEAGHEIASHGMDHRRIYEFDDAAFSDDIRDSKKILEDVSGQEILGYRAPSFSMTMDKWHFFELLERCGYKYSSSVFPAKTDHYGIPQSPRTAFYPVANSDFVELPMTVAHLGAARLPASGGGYFRLLPSYAANWLMKRAVEQTNSGVVFYMHPWEADPEQPYVKDAPLKSRIRHYTGQGALFDRLSELFETWQFTRADAYLKEVYGVEVAA